LGVFRNVDISSLVLDPPSHKITRTIFLWDVFNKSDQRAKWGNSAIDYILDNRLQVTPDGEIDTRITEKLRNPWETGPQSLKIQKIAANARSRWVSQVDHKDSQRVVEAILKGRQHPEVRFDLPESVFVDPKELPLNDASQEALSDE
jgi:hypothetical protein